MKPEREDAVDAFAVLNTMVGDLIIGTQCWGIFQSPPFSEKPEGVRVCMNRMCIDHLILTLSKWTEFYSRFHSVIPDECRKASKALLAEIHRRQIPRFRNTIVGHILDRKTNRVLLFDEQEKAFWTTVDGDIDAFLTWVNNPDDNSYPATVVSVVECVRDRIRDEFDVSEQEAFPGNRT